MTKSDEIQARQAKYNRIERVTDSLGRTIGVRRLKPSQQIRIQELAPGLEGTTTVVDEKTGKTFDIPKSSPLIFAASVAEVDGSPFTFPKTRGELDAVLDMLDDEGLAAVVEALGKLSADEDTEGTGGSEAAKNSRSTPRSDKPSGS